MRIVLWLMVLVTVCAALLLWNQRITTEARAERDALRQGSAPSAASTDEAADGFGHVFVGEKSGAPILEPDPSLAPPPAVPPVTDPRNAHKNAAQNPAPGDDAQHEMQYVVAAGESLSTICQRHYGTSRPDVVAAVARANKLEKADQIRAGMKIVLPAAGDLSKTKH